MQLSVIAQAWEFHSIMDYTRITYEGWNFNSGNYLFTTDTKYE